MPAARGRRGGRPSRQQAARLTGKILDVATELFLTRGFGGTSIEAVAARARMSKRTFYHRFKDKGELFQAVVRRLIERWLPPFDALLFKPGPIDELLRRTAKRMLSVALSQEALALHRVVLSEAERFPELAQVMTDSGARKGTEHIAELLTREARAGHLRIGDSRFAAEQFMSMVLSVPQRRALGLGQPLGPKELDRWARRTVDLFLDGCRSGAAAGARVMPPGKAARRRGRWDRMEEV